MLTIESIHEKINKAFKEIELPATPSRLYDPISYTLQLGGKRLRPFLVLAACDLFDGNPELAINPAIGIELFHNFTLLHDDLMDQAPLRRGKPTVYKKWNSNVAILSGDTLFALSNRYMLKTREAIIPALLDQFNLTAVEVCEGQQHDMDFETRSHISIPEYIEMIRLKTAVLLACSLKAGAMIAGAEKRCQDGLYDFGINIGIAFQLMDDYLDLYGSEEKFGKIRGGDILVAKKTFLYLKALELSGRDTEDFISLYQSLDMPADEKIASVKAHFDKLEIQAHSHEMINKYWDKAVTGFSSLGLPESRTAVLLEFCAKLMDREY